jgi:uncharacterized protein VirK/YbjX
MKFYEFDPIDKFCGSRRWFVDGARLDDLKSMYESYPNKDGTLTNRLSEFNIKETSLIWIDFGGMMHKDTPVISTKLNKTTTFEILVTHIPTFIRALKSERLYCDETWRCSTRFKEFMFSKETHDKLLDVFATKKELYEEMIEGFNKKMDLEIAKNPKVIALKKYHCGGNEDPTKIM